MFFSEHDVERIAFSAWLWDVEHGLTFESWEMGKARYREKAAFIVDWLNNGPVAA